MSLGIGLGLGIAAGIFSGLLGIGGGTISVPGMVLLLKTEQHTAQGVALAAMLAAALFGAYVQYRQENVDLRTAALIGPGAAAFSFLGAYAASLVSPVWLTRVFAIVLMLLGARMLFFARGVHDARHG